MAFNKPSIELLANRVEKDLQESLEKHGLQMSHLLAKIFSTSLSGAFYSFYDSLEFLYKQISPLTAEEYNLHLFGGPRGIEQGIGQRAVLSITINTADGKESNKEIIISKGTKLKDLKCEYALIEDAYIPKGKASIITSCVCEQEGIKGNVENGASLKFEQTPTNTNEDVVVEKTIVKGADKQRLEEYRELVIEEMRYKEQGGNANDYLRWINNTEAFFTKVWVKRDYSDIENKKGMIVIYVIDHDKLKMTIENNVYKYPEIKKSFLDQTEKNKIEDSIKKKAPLNDRNRIYLNPFLRPMRIVIKAENKDKLTDEEKSNVFRCIKEFSRKLNIGESVYDAKIASLIQRELQQNFEINRLELSQVTKNELVILESIEWT